MFATAKKWKTSVKKKKANDRQKRKEIALERMNVEVGILMFLRMRKREVNANNEYIREQFGCFSIQQFIF
jgi:hypothetical protein